MEWLFGGGGLGPGIPPPMATYSAKFSVTTPVYGGYERIENGDKVILPQSTFEDLARMNIEYPMMFRIDVLDSSDMTVHCTHCGVSEFTAPEGTVVVPQWMCDSLGIRPGPGTAPVIVRLTNVTLPKASFAKFQPLSEEFLDISNPKAVLEMQLRSFSCLTRGERISFSYVGKRYGIEVVELRPANACSIIETDMLVDFAPPPGYKEPTRPPSSASGDTTGGGGAGGASTGDAASVSSGGGSTVAADRIKEAIKSAPPGATRGIVFKRPMSAKRRTPLERALAGRKPGTGAPKVSSESFGGGGHRLDGAPPPLPSPEMGKRLGGAASTPRGPGAAALARLAAKSSAAAEWSGGSGTTGGAAGGTGDGAAAAAGGSGATAGGASGRPEKRGLSTPTKDSAKKTKAFEGSGHRLR